MQVNLCVASAFQRSFASLRMIHRSSQVKEQFNRPDLQLHWKQAIITPRCRESSSIFRASGFYYDSGFLSRCCKQLRRHCFVG
jgi:hypothetical protein